MINKPLSPLLIKAHNETERVVCFIQNIVRNSGKKNVVIGWSGGIDSTVCLFLLVKAISPKNVFVYHLPYIKSYWDELKILAETLCVPKINIQKISIKRTVGHLGKILQNSHDNTRYGNCMARVRMIYLFDQAKYHDALVCGTENRTECLLGYFTRYGDAASDFEPISHLFKTQIYNLAAYLKINEKIIQRTPTADLWKNQSDEGDFGFTYKEADEVLFRYVDKHMQIDQIQAEGFVNTKQIIKRLLNNKFKQEVPYRLR